jgi:hypothetical protein
MADSGYCQGQFESIRIGVSDIFWTPDCGFGQEVYMGLTKGGVELTYTPEYYDLTVDQYGRTPIDSVLIGEGVSVTIPLAETELGKLALYAPTATPFYDTTTGEVNKLTFGQRPGLRLGTRAGVLRLHPIALGNDLSEDVTLYRAVHKGTLNLNYQIDQEAIYNLEIIALVDRGRFNGQLLFEIGNPALTIPPMTEDEVEQNIKDIWKFTNDFSLEVIPISGTLTTQPSGNHTRQFKCNCIYDYKVYDVTESCGFKFVGDAVTQGANVSQLTDSGTPIDIVTGVLSGTGNAANYVVTAASTDSLRGGSSSGPFTAEYKGSTLADGTSIKVTLMVNFGPSKFVNVGLTILCSTS